MMRFLAQDGGAEGLFTNVLLLTILFIFLSAIMGAVIARRRRDRCLKLFNDYHVTMAMVDGKVIWGDLHVFAQGFSLEYDAPYQTPAGLIKSSYLLYQPEMGNLLTLCRYVGDLTEYEKQQREQQVLKRFKPNFFRRSMRSIRNIFNTIRDAFSQALGAVIGQMSKTGPKALSGQKSNMEQMGQSLLGAVGNAYEPMLEKFIGKPVVLELSCPADPDTKNIELTGYLAEYSDKYLAVFNIDHPTEEKLELGLDESIEREDLTVEVNENYLTITNLDDRPLVVDALISDDGEKRQLGIVLTHSSRARLSRIEGNLTLKLLQLKKIDLICPRSQAVVRFASMDRLPPDARRNLPPAHEDQKVSFP